MMLRKVVSGGQTGVDQAALDAAEELGLSRGGWCPRGRASERGPIDSRYPLAETPSEDPAQRTEWNVRDSDATLIVAARPLEGGTALTRRLAEAHGRPCLVVDPADVDAPETAARWIREHGVRTLNVAGPRQSRGPETYRRARALLLRALRAAASEAGSC